MQEEEIDLREYINVLLKRKGIIILIFLIAVITAVLVSYFYLKPVYQASTILMISSKQKYQVELEPKIQTQFTPEVSLATYESLIKDREIEEEVIKKLNLDQPPYEFSPDSLQGMISIESLKNTNLIKMNLQAGEPKLAKDIANVWAALFVEKNKDLNLQESKEAQGFIEEQLKISNQNLSKIEEETREFNETNKIDAMDKEITVKLDKIMASESRLADVKISTESEKAKIEEIRSQMISQEKLISSSNIDRLTEGMKFVEAKDFIGGQLSLSEQNLSKIEEEIRGFNETNKIDAMDKEITVKLDKIMANESRLADVKISTESEKAKIEEIISQMISQGKLISSSNIDRLTEGMKFIEAKDFIGGQLELAQQNLQDKEEQMKIFNQESKISLLERGINEKVSKIIENESRLTDLKVSVEMEKTKIEGIQQQMISQEKLISSSNIDRLTEGMKFTEAKDFIGGQLELAQQNLQDKEEQIKTFNQESKISLLEKEITSKTNQIVNFNNRFITLKMLIEQEKTKIVTAKAQLNEQEKTFILTKTIYDDASLSQLISEISEGEALLLKNLKLKSEELNSLYINLEGRIINSEINLETYQTEMAQVTESIDVLENELEKAKNESAIEKLKLANLEREYKISENVYTMLANKMKEIEIATATPENQQKIARFTNPEYLSLQKQLIGATITYQTLFAEREQLIENVKLLEEELEKAKNESAIEKLKLANLEREYKISENVYTMLANKMKEIEIATATPENQQKIAQFTNPEYLSLQKQLIGSTITQKTLQAEERQLKENIDDYWEKIGNLKQELAQEELTQSRLEREKKVLESTYIMLANKMKEIEIATATPENQQKIAQFTNPEYLSLQKQLIESTIMQKTLKAEEKQLRENVNEAWKRVEVLKQELAQEKLTQSRLEREYNTAKGVYDVLSQKNEEVKIAVATESGLVKIASLAYEPRGPIKPNKKLNILIAGVLGLFVGIFAAFFLEFWQKGKS